MNIDDIIYFICLLCCIGFGQYFRSIKNDIQRKLIGTAFGILIIFIVSGFHGVHCFISFTICALIIIYSHPSQCHIRSFGFMFGYLVFFRTVHYFGIPSPPGHTNMIQMILTLKMSGVAFEKNTSYQKISERNKLTSKDSESTSEDIKKSNTIGLKDIEITEYDVELQNINFIELFHYSFNYIGVLIGPYYRYRTYRDYYETPFKNFANCTKETIEKSKIAALCCCIYLISNFIFPVSYNTDEEFYEKRSVLYRLFYIYPNFLNFRMRIFSGLILGEMVCSAAGFGAYPDDSDVAYGEGPKKQYLHYKRDPEKQNYNFNTIRNIDIYNLETCSTFRESMKHWNICVQYWLAVNVHRRFPNKKFRIVATLFVSSFWHGIYPGYYFCLMIAPFYVPIEEMFLKLLRKYDENSMERKLFNLMFWLSKFFTFGYGSTAFLLQTFGKIWRFYSSVYHIGYIYFGVMAILAFILTNLNKSKDKQKNKASENKVHDKKLLEEHQKIQ